MASAPATTSADSGKLRPRLVVVTGNPNCGKTTLFNALTGLRTKVGNYPGVTVERKEGRMLGAPRELPVTLLDLPGTYSLSPQSPDEQIARDVLFHRLPDMPPPEAVVVVVDASNLQRNLYFATQVIELGYPTFLALNMVDVARQNGVVIDTAALSTALGVPVLPVVASTGQGLPLLRETLFKALAAPPAESAPRQFWELPPPFKREIAFLAGVLLTEYPGSCYRGVTEALLLLTDERFLTNSAGHYPPAVQAAAATSRQRLEEARIDWRSGAIAARYDAVAAIQSAVTTETDAARSTFSDRVDRIVTHKVWGVLLFMLLMAVMFQSIFTFAELPMKLLEHGVDWAGAHLARLIPPGALHSLLVDGVVAGVGAVLVFLPQICLLFLFIGLLEDTGYMARAAFLMDRLMSKVGLHGKSFIPMLSSYACAIPGIMAARVIETPRDRLATILVAPLMNCSARLPVFTVLIAACIPDVRILGVLKLQGVVLLSMYVLGTGAALLLALLFKKTLLRGPTPMLILELPPYKRPLLHTLARHVWERARLFLRQVGTLILGLSIIFWFLTSYPKDAQREQQLVRDRAALSAASFSLASPAANEAERERQSTLLESAHRSSRLRESFAGRMGRFIEPALAPIGFDWKIGIGIISSFASREVFVSTMSLVYNVSESGTDDDSASTLAPAMRAQKRPDGSPLYTPLLGLTLMVFYVFALQCAGTVAVVHRETASWKWPLFQWVYLGLLAWMVAFATWHGGHWLGFQ